MAGRSRARPRPIRNSLGSPSVSRRERIKRRHRVVHPLEEQLVDVAGDVAFALALELVYRFPRACTTVLTGLWSLRGPISTVNCGP